MDAAQIQATMQTYFQSLAATSTSSTPPTSSAPSNFLDQLAMSQYLCSPQSTLNPALLALMLNPPAISAPSLPLYPNPFDTSAMTVGNPLLAMNGIASQNAQLNNAQLLAAMVSSAPMLPQRTFSNAAPAAPSASSSTSSLATPMRPSASPGSDSENSNGCRKRRHHNDDSTAHPRSQTHSPISNNTDSMRSRAFTCPDGVKTRAIAQKVKQNLPKKYSTADISNPVNRHHPDNMEPPSGANLLLEQMAAIYLMNAMSNDPEALAARKKVSSDKRFRPVWDDSRENTPERDEPEIDVVAVDPPKADRKPIAGVKLSDVVVLIEKNYNATQA
uniref:BHLH domain-containing protein n=1 Tax=Panagrellus redivivus TaxID=6233 RepID=A0A7E4VFX3_PANRE